jgi:hypothetical protein
MPGARRRTAKKGRRRGGDYVDVRSLSDVRALKKMFRKYKIVVVLVYADWCGHCTRYKEEVWNRLPAETKGNRKVGLAAIQDEQLPNTPLAGAKINGYPNVLAVGSDMKPAVFKEPGSGELTHDIPNSRDINTMKAIVNSDPEQVMNNVPAEFVEVGPNVSGATEPVTAALPNLNMNNGMTASPAATGAMNLNMGSGPAANMNLNMGSGPAMNAAASANALNLNMGSGPAAASNMNLNMGSELAANSQSAPTTLPSEEGANSMAKPPNVENDLLLSQTTATGANVMDVNKTLMNTSNRMTGGSLYQALLEAGKVVAPAALLTVGGVMAEQRRRSRKGKAARGRRTARLRRRAAKSRAAQKLMAQGRM